MPTTIDVKDAAGTTRTVATNDALAALIGEVQASPTTNTLLARLRDITTATSDVYAALSSGVVAVNDNGGSMTVDDGGVSLTVDDGGSSLTVDGTVELGPTALAALETITVASVTAPLAAGTNEVGGVNVTKFAGTAADTNSGSKSAGTLRVVLATDQPALTNAQPVKIDQTTPGTTNKVEAGTNVRRNSGVLHRSAITSADKLATVGTITLAGTDTVNGSLTSATTYYVSAAAYNRWGNASPATVVSTSPGGSNKTMRATFSQVTGADGYDIFLSTDAAAPKWVARVTESERASGVVVTAVGTTTTSGGTAGAVDIRVVGTGLQTTVTPFTQNNAYTPATPTAINCAGYSRAILHVKLAVTDLRSLPALTLIPFFADQTSGSDYFADLAQTLNILTGDGQPLEQQYTLDVNGATGLSVLVSSISGQGAAASVWVELA